MSVFTIGRRLKGDFLHPNIYELLLAKPWLGGRRGRGIEMGEGAGGIEGERGWRGTGGGCTGEGCTGGGQVLLGRVS